MKQKWKQKLPGILLGLVFLVGLGVFAYPTVADQWNKSVSYTHLTLPTNREV